MGQTKQHEVSCLIWVLAEVLHFSVHVYDRVCMHVCIICMYVWMYAYLHIHIPLQFVFLKLLQKTPFFTTVLLHQGQGLGSTLTRPQSFIFRVAVYSAVHSMSLGLAS